MEHLPLLQEVVGARAGGNRSMFLSPLPLSLKSVKERKKKYPRVRVESQRGDIHRKRHGSVRDQGIVVDSLIDPLLLQTVKSRPTQLHPRLRPASGSAWRSVQRRRGPHTCIGRVAGGSDDSKAGAQEGGAAKDDGHVAEGGL